MATNLEKLKEKLQKAKSGTGKNYIWKPSPGENTIRIVPYQYNPDDPFIELQFHYFLKQSLVSLSTYGDPDPIVELSDELKHTGDKEDWKLGTKISPKPRYFVPIIVIGKEAEGTKFWSFGIDVYTELLKVFADPDYGDIADPEKGRNLILDYTTPKDAKNDYGIRKIRMKPNTSAISADPNILHKILNEQPNIEDIYPRKSYSELESILKKWMNDKSNEATASEVTDNAENETTEENTSETNEVKNTEEQQSKSNNKVNNIEQKVDTKPETKSNVKVVNQKEFDTLFDDVFNKK